MRELGDAYVKNEFKLHKTATTKPAQVEQFFAAWENYLEQILVTARARQVRQATGEALKKTEDVIPPLERFGRDLPHDIDLSQEQQDQLETLRRQTTEAGAGARKGR